MAQINPALPTIGQPNSSEDPDIVSAFTAILGAINGGIDTSNLSASAGVLDTQLASPGNGVSRLVSECDFSITPSSGAGDYGFNFAGGLIASGATGTWIPVWLDPAKFAVAGKTAKCKVRYQFIIGGSPGVTVTFQLYGITSVGGTSSVSVTLAAAVAGSSAASGAGTQQSADSSLFTMPAAGMYILGVNLSGTPAASSVITGRVQLLVSHA